MEQRSAFYETQVIVVGGGLAGTHCAYRLSQGDVDVALFEASDRIGGRTYSTRPGEFGSNQVAELGGELVNSNHIVMQWLSYEFELELDRLPECLPENVRYGAQNFIRGQWVEEAQIGDDFKPILKALQNIKRDLEKVPEQELAETRWRLDRELGSISDFLKTHGASAELIATLRHALTGDYGLELEELSVFNMIDAFDAPPPAPEWALEGEVEGSTNPAFAESDELMRFHNGNDGPARAMAGLLGDKVHLGHALTKLEKDETGYLAHFSTAGNREVIVRAPYIVLAIPFSTLRLVEVAPGAISPELWEVIQKVSYGKNTKLMGQFKTRDTWVSRGHDGTLLTDLKTHAPITGREIHCLWDTARGQTGPEALLTNFVGGISAEQIADGSAEEQWQSILPALEQAYPGAASAYEPGSAQRQVWHQQPWARGSYAVARVGELEWADRIPTKDNNGSLQFCGEHTSIEHPGFMEGAAETGARAAYEIFNLMSAPIPRPLRKIMRVRQLQPRRSPLSNRSLTLAC